MEVITTSKIYNNSLTKYSRFKTREVMVGNIGIGGNNPIRVQSMTTTDTMDTKGTVEQSIRMIEAGSELVRITAPAVKEAKNLENIKNELRARGYDTPLVADIHFKPDAAELAARIVEKVRVNPGNYADKKKFKVFSFTDELYNEELERIYEQFSPLVKICKEYGTAMRIGTNHGSLSDRIMNRYGDTPIGMVESALEFVRICRELNYHEIILSMKSSNTQVMVEAYRLLVNRMIEEGMNYPLHLGVTEAGDGEDGRIKSSVGIGTLLEDGLGDTIRVSLTEDPEFEIPVCKRIVERYNNRDDHKPIVEVYTEIPYDPFSYQRRKTYETDKIGNHHVPVVILSLDAKKLSEPSSLEKISYSYSKELDKWNIGDLAPDFIYLGANDLPYALPGTLKKIFDYSLWKTLEDKSDSFPLFTPAEYLTAERRSYRINFVSVTINELTPELLKAVKNDKFCVLVINTSNQHGMGEERRAIIELMQQGIETPVIISRSYADIDDEDLTISSATDLGALLIDGIGDGIWIKAENNIDVVNRVSFGILQATRTRISKTEYISCPSCGRTQFDLQVTTAMIKKRTDHLKGVKIAIMGCIVNGPGEMADADYGFVGSGPNWITLYRGKEVIERGIPYPEALDKLIGIMKEDGIWVEN
ncbi:MAG TPA: (E)-4-hydroxy-3-methylbut-2-enyl-diphosphate synthase [Ignavibacteria bacterium]|nr:(E)-4-hydroxy-3-methylbut-2-enyl-diphosphate synthase [Ignavibacteria bacterium]HMQ98862.1 (E)-4-hydroxy-3-methylbut-2-enyl-diphosphate synthase [Ignavibacteria bacterium]